MLDSTTERRFWSKVARSDDPAACWEWTAAKRRAGYGSFAMTVRGRRTYPSAHRVAWLMVAGPIPDGLFVCHRCDNPPCVRPSHLFLGTAADNNRDRDQKGRGIWSGWHPNTKLPWQQVDEIRRRWNPPLITATQLAREYGVTAWTVGRIVHGDERRRRDDGSWVLPTPSRVRQVHMPRPARCDRCSRPVHARRLCTFHYRRQLAGRE